MLLVRGRLAPAAPAGSSEPITARASPDCHHGPVSTQCASTDLTWRVLFALGAVPAAAVIYLRCRMPESPRYQAQVQGRAEQAASQIPGFTGATANGDSHLHQIGLRAFLTNRRWLITLAGTAGCWFLLDYAYYGNTISTPQILGLISPHASTMTKIALQLAIFTVAAVPGYLLAIARLDRIGHRKLQLTGFAVMVLCFLLIAAIPGMTTAVVPFLLVYGVSYFFTEFGPNMTTFVIPSEVYPVEMRATGHGISAGVGKLGAFIGVFLFPVLQTSLGLRGTLLLTAAVSGLGFALTRVLPETSQISLEEIALPPRPQPPRRNRQHTTLGRPPDQGQDSARSRIPRSVFLLITKLTAWTGSTSSVAHDRLYPYLSRTSSRVLPFDSPRSTKAQVKSYGGGFSEPGAPRSTSQRPGSRAATSRLTGARAASLTWSPTVISCHSATMRSALWISQPTRFSRKS